MYTVVQHSGVTTGHTEFARGLEPRGVTNQSVISKIREAGGLLFADYGSADDYCDEEMYPPNVAGLIPQAPGRFNELCKVDGSPIYLP